MNAQDPVIVTISYDPKHHIVVVTPLRIEVTPGQTMQFRRAEIAPGRMRLTFDDQHFFETDNPQFATTGVFHEGDGDVRVKTMPNRTAFRCELMHEDGKQFAEGMTGGHTIEPPTQQK
jgi:hypothetical protein